VFTFLLFLILRLIFSKTPSISISLFIGLSIFVTFNGYLIENFVFDDSFGSNHKIRYVAIIYLSIIFICGIVTHFITRHKNFLSIVLVAMTAFSLFDITSIAYSAFGIYQVNNKRFYDVNIATHQTNSDEKSLNINSNKHKKQNIYFILPDMMIGEEVFEKYKIEVEILDGFRRRGFHTISNAKSNAPVTEFSLAHIFGMNYYLEDNEQVTEKKMHEIRNIYTKENNVYHEFRNRGYKIIALDDGYWSGCGRGEDMCIENKRESFLKEQDLRFMERTPFMKSLDLIDYTFNIFPTPMNIWPYTNRMEVPEIIEKLPDPNDGPYFIYMHLGGLPHHPLRFDRNCKYQRFDDTKSAYSEQYRCTVKLLESLVDAIQSQDDNPIIIVHSDHGVGFENQHLQQVEDLTYEEMHENLSIFSAFKLPSHCNQYLSTELSPVNTFRITFACLDNQEPELLPNRSFLVYYLRWPSGGKVREWIH